MSPIHIGAKVPIEQEFEILEAIRTDLLRAKARLGVLYGDPEDEDPKIHVFIAIENAESWVEEFLREVERGILNSPYDLKIAELALRIYIRRSKGGE